MKLPKLDFPTYELTLPSDGTKITFRPYTVKEQKLWLMALESSESENDIENAIKQVAQNCIITPEDFKIGGIASFDLEYIFIHLRARSTGEKINRKFLCTNIVKEDIKCGKELELNFNILEVPVFRPDNHDPRIFLTSSAGIVMKYPTLDLLSSFPKDKKATDLAISYICGCIAYIWEGEEIIRPTDIPEKELEDFILDLPKPQFLRIEQFFESCPVIKQDFIIECPGCGYKHEYQMEGLTSFFD